MRMSRGTTRILGILLALLLAAVVGVTWLLATQSRYVGWYRVELEPDALYLCLGSNGKAAAFILSEAEEHPGTILLGEWHEAEDRVDIALSGTSGEERVSIVRQSTGELLVGESEPWMIAVPELWLSLPAWARTASADGTGRDRAGASDESWWTMVR